MKNRIICFALVITTLIAIFTTTAFAQTTTVIIKPEYTEDTVVAVNFKDGQLPGAAEYVYTGEKIMPEVVVTKIDNTIADPSEYTITYGDNCDKTGRHVIIVEYLKSGYKVALDYSVVPGTTSKVDVTTNKNSATISWASVPGATHYRVYQYDDSKGSYVEVYWEDGSIAAPKTSRTLNNLEPGKTYNMGIMALTSATDMPTKQMKTFKVTVPVSNKPVESTTEKPVSSTTTTTEPVETTIPTTDMTSTEPSSVIESSSVSETTSLTETESITSNNNDEAPKNNEFIKRFIPVVLIVFAVALIAGGAITFVKEKKK